MLHSYLHNLIDFWRLKSRAHTWYTSTTKRGISLEPKISILNIAFRGSIVNIASKTLFHSNVGNCIHATTNISQMTSKVRAEETYQRIPRSPEINLSWKCSRSKAEDPRGFSIGPGERIWITKIMKDQTTRRPYVADKHLLNWP